MIVMTNLTGKYVELKPWIIMKNDTNRPFGSRNLYYVAKETEKAIKVCPVDTYNVDFSFWSPKSAIINVLTNDEQGKTVVTKWEE